MSEENASRRRFIVGSMSGLSATYVAANWPAAAEVAERARRAGQDPRTAASFSFFTPAQAAEIDALSAQIFPSDDTPGAREARIVYFIDFGLMSFIRDAQPIYTTGLGELQTKTTEMFPGTAAFSALTSLQQIQLMTAVENTLFFRTIRNHTIMGMFAAPQHGGNYDKVGWKLIGFEDNFNFDQPFGYYDGKLLAGERK